MTCCQKTTAKHPDESVVVTFDFTPALTTGETISAIDMISVSIWAGTDPSVSLAIGTAAVDSTGMMVQVPVSGGIDLTTYAVKVQVTTSNAQKVLSLTAHLPVRYCQ